MTDNAKPDILSIIMQVQQNLATLTGTVSKIEDSLKTGFANQQTNITRLETELGRYSAKHDELFQNQHDLENRIRDLEHKQDLEIQGVKAKYDIEILNLKTSLAELRKNDENVIDESGKKTDAKRFWTGQMIAIVGIGVAIIAVLVTYQVSQPPKQQPEVKIEAHKTSN